MDKKVFENNFLSYIHPNFFIIGAAKSGTTSLWYYLRQHCQVYMPELKEPSFFSFHYKHNLNYERYLSLFSEGKKKKAVGEASHAYLTSPESPGLINRFYPDAKIVIILRNPADRSFSLYQWMAREGYEWIYPFEKALEAEEERINDENFRYNNPQYCYNYYYYNSGLYSSQIQRYITLFPKKQIKFLFFDDLKINPYNVIKELYSFLEIDINFTPQVDIKNRMRSPLSVPIQFFLRKKMNFFLKKFKISRYYRKKIVKHTMDTNIFLGHLKKEVFSEKTKKRLVSLYRNDILKTGDLIEKKTKMWL